MSSTLSTDQLLHGKLTSTTALSKRAPADVLLANLTSEQWYRVGVLVTVHLAAEQTYGMMSDWPCLSPLVGSCLRRDTTEAATILSKSLSDEALIC